MKKLISIIALIGVIALTSGCGKSSESTGGKASASSSYGSAASSYISSGNSGEQDNYDYNGGDLQDDEIDYEAWIKEFEDEVIRTAKKVTYQQLARSKDGMEGENIIVKGEILFVMDMERTYEGLISITYVDDDYFPYYTDEIWYSIEKSRVPYRLLEEDVVTFTGIAGGLYTYETVMGNYLTVPSISVVKMKS